MRRRSIRSRLLALSATSLAALCDGALAEAPPAWTLTGTYTADLLRNTRGGLATGNAYLDNLDLTLEIDGERALGIPGLQLFAYGLYNNDSRFSERFPGDALTASNIDAPRDIQLYEFWADWAFGQHASSVRMGLYDLNSEFDASEVRDLFLNSSFGIGHELAQTGVNGPSIFPATSLALRIALRPAANWALMMAAFDGVPGGTNDGRSHFHLGGDDGALLIAELQRTGERLTKVALGAWRYTQSFERIGNEIPGATGARQANSSGAYAFTDFVLWEGAEQPERRLEAFARVGVATSAVNEYDRSAQLGVVMHRPFSAKTPESLGLAITSAHTGRSYRRLQQTLGAPIEHAETAVELTYRRELTSWLTLQPDVQWIIDPGATRELRNALVVGLRVELAIQYSR
jgi:porin